MASPAEAMKWHTERFLKGGPGAGVNAYPRIAEDGTVHWYTFQGTPTYSPIAQPTHPTNKIPKFAYAHSQDPPELAAERDDESITARNLCRIAYTRMNKTDCPGAYAFASYYNDAYCGLDREEQTTFPVSRSQYRQASTD